MKTERNQSSQGQNQHPGDNASQNDKNQDPTRKNRDHWNEEE